MERINWKPCRCWKNNGASVDGNVGCVQALEHSAHEMRNEDPGK